MMKVFWHKSLDGWQKPEITPIESIVLHPAAKVLHYAVEVNIFSVFFFLFFIYLLWLQIINLHMHVN